MGRPQTVRASWGSSAFGRDGEGPQSHAVDRTGAILCFCTQRSPPEPLGFTGGPRHCPRCSHPLPTDCRWKFPEAETKYPRVCQSLRSRGSNVGRLFPDTCQKIREMLPYKAVYVSFR